ncbi:MAG: DUF3500 domain-containing protein [Verrucomicrobia bacterium]|nr:DUF3500 domain-containing protein [Verrucomicrobiota bacterium]
MRTTFVFGILLAAAAIGWVAMAAGTRSSGPPAAADLVRTAEEMEQAASNWLAALSPDQQRRAVYRFKDEERRNFHYFPIPRRGVPLKELNDAQRQLAYVLVSTALSARGYMKALTVMSLGQVLRDLDPEPSPFRDSDQYYFTIFGSWNKDRSQFLPDRKGTWGWRIEGFHLSINVTIVDGKAVVSAPTFMGAHPATVKEGRRMGLRALPKEEDLGRRLAQSLDADQRRVAFHELPIFEETVGGLLTGNARKIERTAPEGLPESKLRLEQAAALWELVQHYAHNHRAELAEQDLAKIDQAGREKIHFRWAGGLKPGEGHHYMIQGPTFIIEYDNTQDGANHVHCVWRDFDNDFGDDLLRRHYEQQQHRR